MTDFLNGLDEGTEILIVLSVVLFSGFIVTRLTNFLRLPKVSGYILAGILIGPCGLNLVPAPLLACMVFGAAYINLTSDKKLYHQINNFTPPILSLFFIVSGMNLDLGSLASVGAVGVCYFFVRIIGKYAGTYLSCLIVGTAKETRRFLGLALIPQAGVAIGLAFLGRRLLPPEMGRLLLTIILSSSVLYEMAGPVSAKAALILSGAIPAERLDAEKKKKENRH